MVLSHSNIDHKDSRVNLQKQTLLQHYELAYFLLTLIFTVSINFIRLFEDY